MRIIKYIKFSYLNSESCNVTNIIMKRIILVVCVLYTEFHETKLPSWYETIIFHITYENL